MKCYLSHLLNNCFRFRKKGIHYLMKFLLLWTLLWGKSGNHWSTILLKINYCVYSWVLEWFNSLIFVGKTTLADCLVASNGIISSRLAGKVSDFILNLVWPVHVIQDSRFSCLIIICVKFWCINWAAEVPGQPGGWTDQRNHHEVQCHLSALQTR